MKTAIYIEDGVVQLVLTPENDFEKNALRSFEEKPLLTTIRTGSFYNTRGGWTRHGQDDASLILRMDQRSDQSPGSRDAT